MNENNSAIINIPTATITIQTAKKGNPPVSLSGIGGYAAAAHPLISITVISAMLRRNIVITHILYL